MKIGLTSLTFRNSSIKETVEYAVRAGIDGIEWGICENHVVIGDEERAQKIKQISRENNIEIFSLGSYCKMTDINECMRTLETACMAETPIVRMWAGEKGNKECGEEYYTMIVENSRRTARQAAEMGLSVCFEYHHGTLTDNAQDAVTLIHDIGEKNVGLYWQPQGALSAEKNLRAFKTVKPYVLKNIHVNNCTAESGYELLSEIYDDLRSYFGDISDGTYNLLIEFVKDASPVNLVRDAETLRGIISYAERKV